MAWDRLRGHLDRVGATAQPTQFHGAKGPAARFESLAAKCDGDSALIARLKSQEPAALGALYDHSQDQESREIGY
jgi:hypothetical protein